MSWHSKTEEEYDAYLEEISKEDDGTQYFILSEEHGFSFDTLSGFYISYEPDVSFEDFKENGEYLTLDEYIDHVSEELQQESYWEEDGIPYMKRVHSEITDSYVDYKRGYESHLDVFEPDYKGLGIKAPKKADRRFLGVSYTQYQMGDVVDFCVSEFQKKTRRITVTEWVSV